MGRHRAGYFSIALILLLAACSQPAAVTPVTAPMASTLALEPTATAAATNTPAPQPTASFTAPAPTFTAASTAELCSPLEDIRLDELSQPDLMKNPFELPRPGIDDGHPGVDFAYWSRGEHKEMLGLGVHSMLAGRVAGLVQNRSPYGYAVIVETSLNSLPQDWVDRLAVPTRAPTIPPAPNLICPPALPGENLPAGRSLYLLYAHFNRPPELSIGQALACGQRIGEVGTTGRSVNPHLHLETRVGPAGATFTELAHYDNSATENEMRNYCTWRVSGLYQLLDPLEVIEALSLQP